MRAFAIANLLLLTVVATSAATPTNSVNLIQNRKTDWRIVSPPPGSPGVTWAAKELQKYLQRLAGCSLPVIQRTKTKPALVVGLRNELTPADRALLPPPASGYDGYAIAIAPATRHTPARIVVAGDNGRGVAYGVYDLLERLGCRWFYPAEDPADPEVVPSRQTLSLPAGAWAVASPMQYRICNGSEWFFEMQPAPARQQLDWAMKARYNAMGWQADTHTPLDQQYRQLGESGLLAELAKRELLLHGPAHSFNLLLRAEDHMKDHPEWFGLRNGQRVPQTFLGAQFCWSNPQARKQFTDNVEAFARSAPQIHILCLVPFDGGQACECAACKQAGPSNLLMLLMGEIIERLKISRPDLLVETVGGYGAVTDPPENAQIHPRQRVVWAHWGRGYTAGYDDARYDRKANLEKWTRAARGGLTVCQYYTDNFAEPWVMSPFTVAIEGDRRYFRQHGIDSVYMLMWPRGYWWNHGLNGYLAGRCFYDFSLSPYDLLRDYALNYFGPDAGPLLADYFESWARDPELCYRVRGDSRNSDRAKLADQRRRWLAPAIQLTAATRLPATSPSPPREERAGERRPTASQDSSGVKSRFTSSQTQASSQISNLEYEISGQCRIASEPRSKPIWSYRLAKVERLHTLAEHLMEVHRQRDQIRALRRAGQFEQAADLLNKSRAYTDEVLALFHALADLKQGLIERQEIPTFITANVKNWIEDENKAITAKQRD